jgi:hypothetical protein
MMKISTLLTTLLILIFLSFNTLAASSNLEQAIQHAQAAIKSEEAKSVAEHAAEAKKYANASKGDTDKVIDRKHLDEGIKCLSDAVKEGKDGNTDEAKKAAKDAVEHFKQAAK